MTEIERARCGRPTRTGATCRSWADECRHHGVKASAEVERQGGGYGNAWSAGDRLAAAQHLAAGLTAEDAARLAGIPGTTVRTWRREDAEFAALVRRMNDELVTEAVYALGAVSRKAVATLDAGMDGKAKPAQIRAADIVLSRLAPLREFELMRDRLEQLEALAAGDQGFQLTITGGPERGGAW